MSLVFTSAVEDAASGSNDSAAHMKKSPCSHETAGDSIVLGDVSPRPPHQSLQDMLQDRLQHRLKDAPQAAQSDHEILALARNSCWSACSFFCCSDSAICGLTSSKVGTFAGRTSSRRIT